MIKVILEDRPDSNRFGQYNYNQESLDLTGTEHIAIPNPIYDLYTIVEDNPENKINLDSIMVQGLYNVRIEELKVSSVYHKTWSYHSVDQLDLRYYFFDDDNIPTLKITNELCPFELDDMGFSVLKNSKAPLNQAWRIMHLTDWYEGPTECGPHPIIQNMSAYNYFEEILGTNNDVAESGGTLRVNSDNMFLRVTSDGHNENELSRTFGPREYSGAVNTAWHADSQGYVPGAPQLDYTYGRDWSKRNFQIPSGGQTDSRHRHLDIAGMNLVNDVTDHNGDTLLNHYNDQQYLTTPKAPKKESWDGRCFSTWEAPTINLEGEFTGSLRKSGQGGFCHNDKSYRLKDSVLYWSNFPFVGDSSVIQSDGVSDDLNMFAPNTIGVYKQNHKDYFEPNGYDIINSKGKTWFNLKTPSKGLVNVGNFNDTSQNREYGAFYIGLWSHARYSGAGRNSRCSAWSFYRLPKKVFYRSIEEQKTVFIKFRGRLYRSDHGDHVCKSGDDIYSGRNPGGQDYLSQHYKHYDLSQGSSDHTGYGRNSSTNYHFFTASRGHSFSDRYDWVPWGGNTNDKNYPSQYGMRDLYQDTYDNTNTSYQVVPNWGPDGEGFPWIAENHDNWGMDLGGIKGYPFAYYNECYPPYCSMQKEVIAHKATATSGDDSRQIIGYSPFGVDDHYWGGNPNHEAATTDEVYGKGNAPLTWGSGSWHPEGIEYRCGEHYKNWDETKIYSEEGFTFTQNHPKCLRSNDCNQGLSYLNTNENKVAGYGPQRACYLDEDYAVGSPGSWIFYGNRTDSIPGFIDTWLETNDDTEDNIRLNGPGQCYDSCIDYIYPLPGRTMNGRGRLGFDLGSEHGGNIIQSRELTMRIDPYSPEVINNVYQSLGEEAFVTDLEALSKLNAKGNVFVQAGTVEHDYRPISFLSSSITDLDLQSYYKSNQAKQSTSAPVTVELNFRIARNTNDFIPRYYDLDQDFSDNKIKYKATVINWDWGEGDPATWDEIISDAPKDIASLVSRRENYNTFDLVDLSDDERLSYTYQTAGLKTIKAIVFSYSGLDDGSNRIQPLRWKLLTIRHFINIDSVYEQDFSEIGGNNFTTIPWPKVNPIISGITEYSDYYQTLKQVNTRNYFKSTEVLDRELVKQSLQNDELGKWVGLIDLEQTRFFTKPYDLRNLLMVDTVDENNHFYPFTSSSYWDGNENQFPHESCVGQLFINEVERRELRDTCLLEFNYGDTNNRIVNDTSGNGMKGILLGDFSVKKGSKEVPIVRDSVIRVPKKTKEDGAL